MSVTPQYGKQKHWFFGSTFDGMNKNPTGGENLGPKADFIFPQNKSLSGASYGSSTTTTTLKVARSLSGSSSGASVVTQTFRGNASPIYGTQKYWLFGNTDIGLNKNDIGGEKFWRAGSTLGDLFPKSFSAMVFGRSLVTGTLNVARGMVGSATGSATVKGVRIMGGSADPDGRQKHWIFGQTFLGLNKNAASVGGQKYWGVSGVFSSLFPLSPFKRTSRVVVHAPGLHSKRSESNAPTSVKVVDAGTPDQH